MTTVLKNGNCLELMKELPAKSVDLLICDLPYGELNCSWDTPIDMVVFWSEFKRIRKHDRVCCIHFCSTKFGYNLIKSWEKGYKMDMVWKKRNKTGGLSSRTRPMRNHEMVYFFYDKCPKYNRDKYHKRIRKHTLAYTKPVGSDIGMGGTHPMNPENAPGKPHFEPINPCSVLSTIEEEKTCYGINKESIKNTPFCNRAYDPPNPSSVLFEEEKTVYGIKKSVCAKSKNGSFKPPNPSSVLETNPTFNKDGKSAHGWDKKYTSVGGASMKASFDPKLPGSVVNEVNDNCTLTIEEPCWGVSHKDQQEFTAKRRKDGQATCYTPLLPVSIVDECDNSNDRDYTLFESTKVFIGKRNHQTEKPQDIIEFFLKYWSDEGDTVLDPTMGSGSTGVACKNMKRNFIGYEMDKKIFKTAQDRIEKGK